MFPLAPGELSESDHARAPALLSEFETVSSSGDNEATLAKLLEIHEMMPESNEVLFNIANTYEAMGDTDNAIKYYLESAETPALAYDSWLAIGDIQGKQRLWAEAAASMSKAMAIKAVDPVAMFNYAVYAQNSGDVEAATTRVRENDRDRPEPGSRVLSARSHRCRQSLRTMWRSRISRNF